MNTRLAYHITVLLLFITTAATAQYIQVDNTYNAQQLVNALVGNSCAQVSNITVNGSPGNTSSHSYGYFSAATSTFPFADGILLSSGFASSAPGPNSIDLSDGAQTWGGDNDLENALTINGTFNATVLEFDFIPATSHFSFDYIFASEEYLVNPDSEAWCDFSDGFAFLLKVAGSTDPYQNLAVVPGTDTPVKVTTVRGTGTCPESNIEYFGGYNGVQNSIDFNGQTVTLTAEADVITGTTYHIKLVIADQGDTQYDSAIFLKGGSFNAIKDLGPDRLIADGNPLCAGESTVLTATVPGAVSYKWYKNDVLIAGQVNDIYTVTTAGKYSMEADFAASCIVTGEVTLEYAPAIVTGTLKYLQCDEDNNGLTAYYLTTVGNEIIENQPGLDVLAYYTSQNDAVNNTNPIVITDASIPFYNTTPNQQIFARIENEFGCEIILPITLSTPSAAIAAGITVPPLGMCETDNLNTGIATFNLAPTAAAILTGLPAGTTLKYYESYANALAYKSPLQDMYTNTVAGGQTIYIRLNTTQGCYGIIPLALQVHYFGNAIDDESLIICQNNTQTLDAGSGYTAYSWSTTPVQTTQQLTVSEPGTYTVTLTNTFGCEGAKTFTVNLSGPAPDADFDINDLTGNKSSVTITVKNGVGVYEYSVNGVNYQDSPIFDGLEPGKYTFYIRDVNGCNPVYKKVIYVLDYPKAFTPNGDGSHETWTIPYMNSRPGISVIIYDRYGKVIYGFSGGSSGGWDGKYNGRPLPATDYWFTIQLENGTTIRDHFALIR